MKVKGFKKGGRPSKAARDLAEARSKLAELAIYRQATAGWEDDGKPAGVLILALPPASARAVLRTLMAAGVQEQPAGEPAREAAVYLAMRLSGKDREAATAAIRGEAVVMLARSVVQRTLARTPGELSPQVAIEASGSALSLVVTGLPHAAVVRVTREPEELTAQLSETLIWTDAAGALGQHVIGLCQRGLRVYLDAEAAKANAEQADVEARRLEAEARKRLAEARAAYNAADDETPPEDVEELEAELDCARAALQDLVGDDGSAFRHGPSTGEEVPHGA